jgi:hypothetical protein
MGREASGDIGLDGIEPRGADTASFGEGCRVAGGAHRRGDEVAYVAHDQALQRGRRDGLVRSERTGVINQQPERLAVGGDRAHEGIVKVGHQRSQRHARQLEAGGSRERLTCYRGNLGIRYQHGLAWPEGGLPGRGATPSTCRRCKCAKRDRQCRRRASARPRHAKPDLVATVPPRRQGGVWGPKAPGAREAMWEPHALNPTLRHASRSRHSGQMPLRKTKYPFFRKRKQSFAAGAPRSPLAAPAGESWPRRHPIRNSRLRHND